MRGEQKGTGPVQVTGSTAVRTVCRYSPSSARVRPSITRVGCSQGNMMKYSWVGPALTPLTCAKSGGTSTLQAGMPFKLKSLHFKVLSGERGEGPQLFRHACL